MTTRCLHAITPQNEQNDTDNVIGLLGPNQKHEGSIALATAVLGLAKLQKSIANLIFFLSIDLLGPQNFQ